MGYLLVTASIALAVIAIRYEIRRSEKKDHFYPFCHYCGRKFLSPRGVMWHIQASHPQVEDWYGEKEATR